MIWWVTKCSENFCVACLMSFVVYFGWKAFLVLWVCGGMLSCKGICNFCVEVVVIEWVCAWSVCHEGCVVRWAKKLPVSGKWFSFGLKVYFDGLNFLLV